MVRVMIETHLNEVKGIKPDGKDPVLVVMAAGMGSRYGGLKAGTSTSGEILMDYSVFDVVMVFLVIFVIPRTSKRPLTG